MNENDDEDGFELSRESFLKYINAEISSLVDVLITTGKTVSEYDLLRGKISALKKAKEVYLNKKK